MNGVNQQTGEGSDCDVRDECVYDPQCPFVRGCRSVEHMYSGTSDSGRREPNVGIIVTTQLEEEDYQNLVEANNVPGTKWALIEVDNEGNVTEDAIPVPVAIV